jgi:hypothetical protein
MASIRNISRLGAALLTEFNMFLYGSHRQYLKGKSSKQVEGSTISFTHLPEITPAPNPLVLNPFEEIFLLR